jgi:tRNA-dihydrouridine synthase 3
VRTPIAVLVARVAKNAVNLTDRYLLSNTSLPVGGQDDDDAAEGRASSPPSGHVDGRSAKRQKTDDRDRGTGKDKKKNRGQNKNRPAPITREPGPKLCRAWELGRCDRERCAFQHSWAGYFEEKPRDVLWPVAYLDDLKQGQEEAGYTVYPASIPGDGTATGGARTDVVGTTIDLATKCPVLADLGYCPFGFRCRFAGAHVARIDIAAYSASNGEGSAGASADPKRAGEWCVTADLHDPAGMKEGWRMNETNWPESSLLTRLRTDKVSSLAIVLPCGSGAEERTLHRGSRWGRGRGIEAYDKEGRCRPSM